MTDARHLAHWPPGVPRAAAQPRTTLPRALEAAAARVPQHPAIVYGGGSTDYATLLARVQSLAGALQQRLGVAPGDRVLLMGQNGPAWVVACQALLRAGAVVVPVSPMSTRRETAWLADDAGARVAIVAQELLDRLPLGDGPGEVARALVFAYAESLPAGAEADRTLPEVVREPRRPLDNPRLSGLEEAIAAGLTPGPTPDDPDALAVLPYTSGTTGWPKGCRHTHATLLASVSSSVAWRGLHAGSVVLTVAPLFHMLGLQNGMNLPLWLGATAVMMPRWHAATAAVLIERHRITAWAAPPSMVIDLFGDPATATRDLSSLALLSGGGAAMPEAVAALLQERLGLTYQEAYGLTETASFLHANPPHRVKRQCLGVPTQGVDSRVVDPDTLAPLPPGEVGELVTRAPQLMLGYWRNAEADRAAFVTIDGQRFFRTGDLVTVDDEGYFFLKDRLKRMINVSGYKVWPAEVESELYAHPAVHEACVIAVPETREGRIGEAVHALIVARSGIAPPTPEAFIAWCRERMAVYKAPRSVAFVDALPKSATGKVLWRELQEDHARQEASR